VPTTIAQERLTNPFAAEAEETSFVRYALTGLGSYPSYYKYMADINKRGPDILGGVPRLASLTALSVRHQLESNAILVDARPERNFNLGHIPGSYAVPHGNAMATWVGWVVLWGRPLVLLSSDASHHDDMVRQLIRIGFDRVHGFLAGGIEAWKSAGLPVEVTNRIGLDNLNEAHEESTAPMVIDVRQRNEFTEDHITSALNNELGELQDHLDGLPRELPLVNRLRRWNEGYHGRQHPAAGRKGQRAGGGRSRHTLLDRAGLPLGNGRRITPRPPRKGKRPA